MVCKLRIEPKHDIEETNKVALQEIKRLGTRCNRDSAGGRFDPEISGNEMNFYDVHLFVCCN